MEANSKEHERLSTEMLKAMEAARQARKIADAKCDEFFRYSRWCLAMTEELAKRLRSQ